MPYKVSKETYEQVYKRDKGRCVLCHSYVPVQLHHISLRGRLKTDDPNNCVMLCYVCHERVHENMRKYTHYLKKYIEEVNSND